MPMTKAMILKAVGGERREGIWSVLTLKGEVKGAVITSHTSPLKVCLDDRVMECSNIYAITFYPGANQ